MRILCLLYLLLWHCTTLASSLGEVEMLLSADQPPDGVVFEIIENDQGLRWAIPQIVGYSERLRERFPDLSIAIVSHGREEFALQRRQAEAFAKVHELVEGLSRQQDIPLHVCGTHAGWYGVGAEDFPAYVDVAPSGPAQIRAYEELGYRLIVISRDP